MKLLKRALPLLLAFAMLFALAACGQSGGTEPKNSDAPAADTPNIGSLGGDNQEHDVSKSVIAESLTYGLRNTGWDLAPWKNNGSSRRMLSVICIIDISYSSPAIHTVSIIAFIA